MLGKVRKTFYNRGGSAMKRAECESVHVWKYNGRMKYCVCCSRRESVAEPARERERDEAVAMFSDFANSVYTR
jgi:hypothetical protein